MDPFQTSPKGVVVAEANKLEPIIINTAIAEQFSTSSDI